MWHMGSSLSHRAFLGEVQAVRKRFTVLRFLRVCGTIIPGLPEQWERQLTHSSCHKEPQLICRFITEKEVIIHVMSLVE
jgi:hypothetical protein